MKLDRESVSALVKLVIFLIVTGITTGFLALLLSNGSIGAHRTEYKAIFSDVTGVNKGDDVRIAGVAVGTIKGIKIINRDKAELTFNVDSSTPLTQNTEATLKFRNLVGQRYLALTQGDDGAKTVLKKDAVIPESRTHPALDLNVLLNGFKPVFQALSPSDTNKFAYEIVQVLQGESGTVEDLLARTSSLTNTLAGRDKLIGEVITNLSSVLDTVGSRDKQLTQTIDTLQEFVTGLKDDRQAILGSIDSISDLSVQTSDLLQQGRPALADDVTQLDKLSKNLSKKDNLKTLDESIQVLPIKMTKLGNQASYGSFFNFYLCEFKGNIQLPAIPALGLDKVTNLVIGGDNGLVVGGARCDA